MKKLVLLVSYKFNGYFHKIDVLEFQSPALKLNYYIAFNNILKRRIDVYLTVDLNGINH